MKIAILGLARSGKSALKLALSLGHEVVAINQGEINSWGQEISRDFPKAKLISQEKDLGLTKEVLSSCDLIIKSPGIDPRIDLFKGLNPEKIISDVEFGFIQLKVKKTLPKIIAVTGSNGKTTTVSMIAGYLECIGKSHFLCGNIGTPFCDYLNEKRRDEIAVVELSSFQLENMPSFEADVAAILNIYPNHQERYNSFEDYKKAKENLRAKKLLRQCGQRKFPLKLLGGHNLENANFAYDLLSLLEIDLNKFDEFCASFNGVEHRMEFVCQTGDNSYYNDSKSTNFIALNAATKDLDSSRNILIVCGEPRGGEDFKQLDLSKIEIVFIYGKASSLELPHSFEKRESLESILSEIDEKFDGYKVLFSPGFPSFDLYENYEKRGEEFKRLVRQLQKGSLKN